MLPVCQLRGISRTKEPHRYPLEKVLSVHLQTNSGLICLWYGYKPNSILYQLISKSHLEKIHSFICTKHVLNFKTNFHSQPWILCTVIPQQTPRIQLLVASQTMNQSLTWTIGWDLLILYTYLVAFSQWAASMFFHDLRWFSPKETKQVSPGSQMALLSYLKIKAKQLFNSSITIFRGEKTFNSSTDLGHSNCGKAFINFLY